ncbi:AI-2E family transporter [Antrihabitans stalactiti]|uniref:AI-2E family transporter n=1 Tax=Antrihabitans stalactiti TaxID=2584121 RepID=A0A848KBC0_9NOCA|nr:AI-2E family transporter [Antrihabitans stalactiti]
MDEASEPRDEGHHDMVAQPHTDEEGPVAEAEQLAAELSSPEQPLGTPGPRFNPRSPFFIGLAASAGVAVTYGAVHLLVTVSSTLVLIGLAFFLALGLEPVVSWLVNRSLPRWAAVTVVFVLALAMVAGFVAAAIPPLAEQAKQLIDQAPNYMQQAQDHSSTIGKLNDRFHLQQRITDTINGSGGSMLDSVVTAGSAIFDALAHLLIVAVLTVYFLADLPRIRTMIYRLVPHTRRPRAILIGDEVFAKVGAYVLGNVAISVIAGIATFMWLAAFGVPYPLLLGICVAIFDLLPVIGSTIAGVVVAAVALTVSLPVCLSTIVFFVGFRLGEDYLLVPKIIGRAVKVPALTTVIAVLVGGALLGIVGALVAIPIAAAIQLLTEEILFPRLDNA